MPTAASAVIGVRGIAAAAAEEQGPEGESVASASAAVGMNAPLTSGNLRQLHLASFGEDGPAGVTGTAHGNDDGEGILSPALVGGLEVESHTASGAGGGGGAASPLGFSDMAESSSGLAGSPPSAGGADASRDFAVALAAPGDDMGVGYEAGGLPLASNESTVVAEVLHIADDTGGVGGLPSPSGDDGRPRPVSGLRGGGGQAVVGNGVGRGRERGGRTPRGVGARRGSARVARNTLHSDASTDDGTSTATHEHPYHAHWEEFTNNDIVDQVNRLSTCISAVMHFFLSNCVLS